MESLLQRARIPFLPRQSTGVSWYDVMTTPTVAISVDCVCAAQGKCFVSEIVAAAEQYRVPLTWLLGVDQHDPLANIKLYHNEYLHRIPAWHELGLHLTFDSGVTNSVAR